MATALGIATAIADNDLDPRVMAQSRGKDLGGAVVQQVDRTMLLEHPDDLARMVEVTAHHPVRTCRMGPDPMNGAVVDTCARAHGIDGLRIADASIMPDIPSSNTNLPTIMLAERVAALLQNDAQ